MLTPQSSHIPGKSVTVLWKLWKVWKLFFFRKVWEPRAALAAQDAPNVCCRRNVWKLFLLWNFGSRAGFGVATALRAVLG